MPHQILPHLNRLLQQMNGMLSRYQLMLDDDFLFGAGVQVPQVATIFDRMESNHLVFSGEEVTLAELLTLITYRYGLDDMQVVGHGGYAIVIGQQNVSSDAPRVVRFVPDHHVRSIIADDTNAPSYDVRLDDEREPMRDADYPLLLSDLFLMPRHTTKLTFCDGNGTLLQAAGYPAKLHCQLLPQVHPFNIAGLNQQMAREAGELLAVALATLGVSVADAHGGNGGALIGQDGQPITYEIEQADGTTETHYVPVVLDYGYYSSIGARQLATLLIDYGISDAMIANCLANHNVTDEWQALQPPLDRLVQTIQASGLPRHVFGRLLYDSPTQQFAPDVWIHHAQHHWETVKERVYPSLRTQSRLSRLYPEYDEVLFPQRIEEYTFVV